MNKFTCLECGYEFETGSEKHCPVCDNEDPSKMLEKLNLNKEFTVQTSEALREKIKTFIDKKGHSAAYIKVCARELERIGHMELALVLETIAMRKIENEALLLEAYGISNDMRLNLSNIITKATEDVKLSKEIAKLAQNDDNERIYEILSILARNEAQNLLAMNGIIKKLYA